MTATLYLPADSAAVSVGADDVAAAIEQHIAAEGLDVTLVRTGSRGLFFLEPVLEVGTPQGRIAYGPVSPGDVGSLFRAGLLEGGAHPLRLGPLEEIPFLARQQRFTFARCGLIDPFSLDDYVTYGGYAGLRRALGMSPQQVVEEITASGLRGRGGAGFPTGLKWRTVLEAPASQKYVVANADEGDSGTYADRMLMEGDPFSLIEGMTIAAHATGASKGFVYIRSEYPDAFRTMSRAIEFARHAGYLGDDIAGSGLAFDIELRLGAGAYICGEETAMLESIEGKRGISRYRPPLPAIKGLFGCPTVVNNVLSLATTAPIMQHGAAAYSELGTGRSRGTAVIQLAGNIKNGGLVEVPFGITVRDALDQFGGGTHSGRPLRAVQLGGPLGAYFPDSLLDTPIDYEAIAAAGGMLGHGGIVAFDETVDLAHQA
ncbi:MAG TPA: NADH-quinone oxidoreductase subunit L, partial [Tepidiformaceae bacterium]|nr:NADH-quinone oxidoreductase subunit L [Tepidiformaceae bacterium]